MYVIYNHDVKTIDILILKGLKDILLRYIRYTFVYSISIILIYIHNPQCLMISVSNGHHYTTTSPSNVKF